MSGTRVDQIAAQVYRISTFVAAVPSTGLVFNQFLVLGEEPLLFHLGHRSVFGDVAAAVGRIVAVDRLRWLTFGHLEADECGAINAWLAAAPQAMVAHGAHGCAVSINDMADRTPRALADGEVIDLGGPRVRYVDTPHVPHGWDAGLLHEESSGTLLCGDLFSQYGRGPVITEGDIVGAAAAAEDVSGATCLTPSTAPTIRRLAELGRKRWR